MSKNVKIIIGIGAIAIIAVLGLVFWEIKKSDTAGKYDSFAQCLKDKNITMYGAEWCPWCQKEKANFGNSFRLVPYVECPQEPQKCLALGIDGYPTWIFPDGKKLQGYQGLEKLSQESGCPL